MEACFLEAGAGAASFLACTGNLPPFFFLMAHRPLQRSIASHDNHCELAVPWVRLQGEGRPATAAAAAAARLPLEAGLLEALPVLRRAPNSTAAIKSMICHNCLPLQPAACRRVSDGLTHLPAGQPAPPVAARWPSHASAPTEPPPAPREAACMPLMLHGGGAWSPAPSRRAPNPFSPLVIGLAAPSGGNPLGELGSHFAASECRAGGLCP